MHRVLIPLLVLSFSSCLLAIDAGSNSACLASTSSACDAGADVSDGGKRDGGLPAVMLLVDTSGSMNAPLMPSSPTCMNCSGNACPQTCPTRARVLTSGLDQFLQTQPGAAWLGLTTFPDGVASIGFMPSGCAPATAQTIALTPTPSDSQSAVSAQTQLVLQAVRSFGTTVPFTGGTPTAPSLRYLATLPALTATSRPAGVILVTDGLANCNPNNVLSCTSTPLPAAELCTLGANCVGAYCRAGYSDQEETVLAVRALRAAGVKVAVIGLGSDFSFSMSAALMNTMADEGGATACAPGVTCTTRYFQVDNEAQLLGALGTALLRVSQ
ncbi:MAG: VWA domain-containing protein [Archangiaceae bacterium]|nr:VWA domain-containing protein [Archangiaceae bacterium]